MTAKLDVVPVATGAYSKTFENIGLIFQLGLAPFGALFVLYVLLSFIGGTFALLIGQIGTGVATALLAAPLFRYYLLNEKPKSESMSLEFGDTEQNLSIVFVGYSLIALIPNWVALYVNSFLGLILFFAMFFAYIRLVLLPALTAVNNEIDLGGAFSKTEGNFWRIFLAGLLLGIPVAIVFGILGSIGLLGTLATGGFASGPISAFFLAALQLVVAGLSIALISGIYVSLIGGEPAKIETTTPSEPTPPNPSES